MAIIEKNWKNLEYCWLYLVNRMLLFCSQSKRATYYIFQGMEAG